MNDAGHVWNDPRFAEGMRRQLAARRARLDAGERHLGWKVGFGAAPARAALGIPEPLVGFMTDASRVAAGVVSLAGTVKLVLEPEVAVQLGADVPAGATREQVAEAIAGVGPAIELADIDGPRDDLAGILAGNIFHRGVLLGPIAKRFDEIDLAQLSARVTVDGFEVEHAGSLTAQPGDPLTLVRHVADLLGAVGERLEAGSVVITGTITPTVPAGRGQTVRVELEHLGELEITYA